MLKRSSVSFFDHILSSLFFFNSITEKLGNTSSVYRSCVVLEHSLEEFVKCDAQNKSRLKH